MLLIKNQKSLIITSLIIIVINIIINVIVFYDLNVQSQRDESTQCLEKVELKHIFIIDKSSPMSVQTQAEILFRIKSQISTIKREEFVSIYQITSKSLDYLEPIFKGCKINNTFDKNLLIKAESSIYSNFYNTLVSPLAEAILDLNLSHLQVNAKRTNMYIYSDLLQNSKNLSLSSTLQAYDSIAQFKSSRLGSVQRPTFINTYIYLHIIPRSQLSEKLVKNRDGFWIWFFGDMRGNKQSYGLERHDLPGSYS